jgi:hypothetical protein
MKKNEFFTILGILSMIFTAFFAGMPLQSEANSSTFTINVTQIRFLDQTELDQSAYFIFYLLVNGEIILEQKDDSVPYSLDPGISQIISFPEAATEVTIIMQLALTDSSGTYPCDLTGSTSDETFAVITYDVNTGHWTGDDYLNDPSGYGRLNGCDDGSIYDTEYDCELWFSISQDDPDGDGIPTWVEEEIYGTDPSLNNAGEDLDNDGVPIEWEWKWGYDPLAAEDHATLDPDDDSLTNVEEYLVSTFDSDPFRKDIYLELDWMDEGPDGQTFEFPALSKQLLKNPFHRRNYVFHVDTGFLGGGELVPFDEKIDSNELLQIYQDYFMHGGTESWKRGIFHYGIYVYDCTPKGYAFSGDVEPYWGYNPGTNSFMISGDRMQQYGRRFAQTVEYYYGSATMHEMGHNFGFRYGDPFGVDAQLSKYPWQIMYYVYRNYKSIMNYRYTYKIFDYSDGTHGFLDNNDWDTIDLSYFEND